MSMAERILLSAVADELAVYTEPANNGRRFKQFLLEEVELEEEEAEQARLYFAGGTLDGMPVVARPPTLTHGYPRQGGPFPQWALTLASENESNFYIGDDGSPVDEDGMPFFDADGKPGECKVVRVKYAYNFLVIADHPDLTLYYYHLLKYLLRKRIRYLLSKSLDNVQISGADLAPDARYLPHDVFVRVLTVTLETDETWVESVATGLRADKVRGIHVDDGGGVTEGAGSVKAGVKVTHHDDD